LPHLQLSHINAAADWQVIAPVSSRTAETGNPPDPMRAGIPVVRIDLDIDGRVIRLGRHRYPFLECGLPGKS